MSDHSSSPPFGILLVRDGSMGLVHQVSSGLRRAIRSGQLAGGVRLPASRSLAQELEVSRSVVVEAYEQLEAEGYLEGRVGSGTFVVEGSAAAPREAAAPPARRPRTAAGSTAEERGGARGGPSARGRSFRRGWPGGDVIDFDGASASTPPEDFPREEWARCLGLASRGRTGEPGLRGARDFRGYDFGEVAGDRSLRRAIADYLFRMKGMTCSSDEIIITAGSSQAALLLGAFLKGSYSSIQVEDPTYPPLRGIFKRLGLRLAPLAVDSSGLDPESVDGRLPLLATPAHHYPTGALLPADRREAIASRLRAGGGIAVEDDYDGELRLRGLPVAPLKSIAPEQVVLMGSFGKVMFPGLRLGYLVAPERLVDRLLAMKWGLALWADSLQQVALARFIDEGRLDRRVRFMKRDCAGKRQLLAELAAGLPEGPARLVGEGCGMHCAVAFPCGLPAGFRRAETARAGFVASTFSSLSILPSLGRADAILLGYGSLGEARLREGFARIAAYIEARRP